MCISCGDKEIEHVTWRFAIIGFFGVAALVAISISMVSCGKAREHTDQIKYACTYTQSPALADLCANAIRDAVLGKQSP
jgi:hypothetical protein